MNSENQPSESDAREQQLNEIIAACARREDAGQPVDRAALVSRYPELANSLIAYFADLDAMRRLPAFEESRESVDTDLSQVARVTNPVGQSRGHRYSMLGPTLLSGDKSFGRYRIVKVLGQGGMGAVYLAQDTVLNRQVSLKTPHVSGDDGVIQRFYSEARAAANLRHAGICPVYDVGDVDGIHYISMAYIAGKPLSDLVRAEEPLPVRAVVSLIRKIALALHHAHQAGVIHRDLKPANIMIDGNRQPIVTDFGLAREIDTEQPRVTQDGQILGTVEYMSPEQVEGDREAGQQSDVYSLGVILYELLTTELPYQGPDTAIIAQIITQDAPPPSSICTAVDAELDAICQKMMARKTGDRYADMRQVAAALTSYLKGMPNSSAKTSGIREPLRGRGIVSSDESLAAPLDTALKEQSRAIVSRHRGTLARLTDSWKKLRTQTKVVATAALATLLLVLAVVLLLRQVTEHSLKPRIPTEPTEPTEPPGASFPMSALRARQCQQAWADYLGVDIEKVVDLPGGVKLNLTLIPPGEYLQGASPAEVLAGGNQNMRANIRHASPQHRVAITDAFYFGTCEVTQSQWRAIADSEPWLRFGTSTSPQRPASGVKWDQADTFVGHLSKRMSMRFRLPTSAEWEYACRAGTPTLYFFGNDPADLADYAWVRTNSNQVQDVGQKKPNPWGLLDVFGNVSEWCSDSWASGYQPIEDPEVNPTGPARGARHVLRGGSCRLDPQYVRASKKGFHADGSNASGRGLRVVLDVDESRSP